MRSNQQIVCPIRCPEARTSVLEDNMGQDVQGLIDVMTRLCTDTAVYTTRILYVLTVPADTDSEIARYTVRQDDRKPNRIRAKKGVTREVMT